MEDILRDTDSEEEGGGDDGKKGKKKTGKPKEKGSKTGLAWLQEGADIMDFLDPNATKKVIGRYGYWCVNKEIKYVDF